MKKTITIITLALSLVKANAQQNTVENFEGFSLSANSAYSSTVPVSPFLTSNAVFEHHYDTAYSYWDAGFVYTNVTDSSTAGFTNMYGVRAYKGNNNSAQFVVGQANGRIVLTAAQTTVSGFYITNTTYAYKSMASGDAFAKKFGGASGNDPDFFKLIVRGYNNGQLLPDSATIMLADFTFTNNTQDYILNTWQFVNTSVLGEVDSLHFLMRSSDVGQFGINTPLYFALDDFGTSQIVTGIAQYQANELNVSVYPNPFTSVLNIQLSKGSATARVMDITGQVVRTANIESNNTQLDLSALQSGVYFIELRNGEQVSLRKLIKN